MRQNTQGKEFKQVDDYRDFFLDTGLKPRIGNVFTERTDEVEIVSSANHSIHNSVTRGLGTAHQSNADIEDALEQHPQPQLMKQLQIKKRVPVLKLKSKDLDIQEWVDSYGPTF